VDHLTKVAHFIPVKTTYVGAKLVELYMSRIMCLHGVPKKIMSDRGSQFTSKFWEKLHESMDTKLNFSSAYHPQTDGQAERTNQSWDKSLPYAEFSYNNSYQASIKMAPFEHCMDGNAGHRYSGVRLEKVRYSGQKYWRMLGNRLKWLERT
jgi:transposase InsO family protein